MTQGTLRISGARVIDPSASEPDAVRDLFIRDGMIVADDPSQKADRTIDARGYVVMAGAIDVHAHIGGAKVNAGRKLRPAQRVAVAARDGFRSGSVSETPSSFQTGYLYAGLGYTTVVDAAVPPLFARHALEEFNDIPAIDKVFLTLAGNDRYLIDCYQKKDHARAVEYARWLLASTGAFGLKAVNVGMVEAWKANQRTNYHDIDQDLFGQNSSSRNLTRFLAELAQSLDLPHPLHLHANNLGLVGNADTTLELFRSLDGVRCHFAHIQFHSYGGDPNDPGTMVSDVPRLIEYFNHHPHLSVDIGQILFGSTTSMTADGPLGQYLHHVTKGQWFSGDTECESGCGIVPVEYKQRSLINALQWIVGLEWILLADDLARVALSTDHPNGAAFVRYPELIALLMSDALRREVFSQVPDDVFSRSTLRDIKRELTLTEIAQITRTTPAALLSLKQKGKLTQGCDADLTIYQPDDDKRRMFALPRWVIKAGEVLVDDTELRAASIGKTIGFSHAPNEPAPAEINDFFAQMMTVTPHQFTIQHDERKDLNWHPV